MLHGGHAIRVAGNENDTVNRATLGKGRHIEANPHIDALLLKIWREIGVGWRGGNEGHPFRLPTSEFQNASADRKKILRAKIAKPLI